MTLEDFKHNLLEEHKRDKKLTIINFLLITAGLIVVAAIVWFLAGSGILNQAFEKYTSMGEGYGYEMYYRIVVPIIIICYLLYPVYKIRQMNQRPKKIDKFIAKLQEGLIADVVSQNTVHKIIIPIILPMIKINLRYCPVEYLTVFLANDYDLGYNFKGYNFPIPFGAVADARIILSGKNANELNENWSDLYSDVKSDKKIENTPLKTAEEFQKFYESDLKTETEGLEVVRKKGKSQYIIYGIMCAVIMGGWITINYLMSSGKLKITTPVLIGGFFGFFAIFYIVIYFTKIKGKTNGVMPSTLNHSFKLNIFKKMVAFINPSFQYILHGHITQGEFLEMGLFQNKHYKLDGNDQITGSHNGVPFQLCDLNVSRTKTLSNEKEGPDEVFYGQVFVAQFNKSFNTEVYLIPKKSGGIFNGNDIKDHLRYDLGDKVILEDPEFMKMYDVYSNDQTDARYIMSVSLMQRIKDLTLKTDGSYFISFKNNRISVANNSETNNFETSLFKATDSNLLQDFYQELCNQLLIIDDLKLNIKIWK